MTHFLSPEDAQRFYDRFGSRRDWQRFYESYAVNELIAHFAFESAQSVFEFGCGTGALAARLLQHHLPSTARYVAADISSTMIGLTGRHLKPWSGRAHACLSDGSP
jgi:ubiquinone/menaquinone biosynthesis C-methylase UbiE